MTQTKHIEMRGVSKAFRFFTLEDLSLDLEPGQIMGFVGPNGAGKSTTIRLHGTARRGRGRDPRARSPDARGPGHRQTRHRLRVRRDAPLAQATLGWHMHFVASIYPGWDAEYANTLVKRFNLRPEQGVRGLSSGEHIKAVLLLALARRPRLLILDEPTTGLDPVARHELLTEFMDVLRDEARSILFSSHNTVDVERISDRITFIDRGRLVASSDKEEFLERWRRIEVQLPRRRHPARPAAHRRPSRGWAFLTLTTNRFSDGPSHSSRQFRAQRASHEPRRDLRRDRHASPGDARHEHPRPQARRQGIVREPLAHRGHHCRSLVGLQSPP